MIYKGLGQGSPNLFLQDTECGGLHEHTPSIVFLESAVFMKVFVLMCKNKSSLRALILLIRW